MLSQLHTLALYMSVAIRYLRPVKNKLSTRSFLIRMCRRLATFKSTGSESTNIFGGTNNG